MSLFKTLAVNLLIKEESQKPSRTSFEYQVLVKPYINEFNKVVAMVQTASGAREVTASAADQETQWAFTDETNPYTDFLPSTLKRTRIWAALDVATKENGYSFAGWTVEEIAVDLADKDAGLEGTDIVLLIPHIKAWLSVNPQPLPGSPK